MNEQKTIPVCESCDRAWGACLPGTDSWVFLRPDLAREELAADLRLAKEELEQARAAMLGPWLIPPVSESAWLVVRILLAVAVVVLLVSQVAS